MSEPNTDSNNPEPELSHSERMSKAGEALVDSVMQQSVDLSTSEVEELFPDDHEASENTSEDEQETAEPKKDDSSEEEEESKEKDSKKEPPDWKWKRVREKEEKAKSAIQSARKAEQEAKQLKADLEQLADDIASNPVEAIYAIAERAGVDPDQLYERIVRSKVSQGIDSPEMQEIKRLRKELAEREKKETELEKKQREEQAQKAREAQVSQLVNTAVNIRNSEEYKAKFPHLSVLKPARVEQAVREGIDWAVKNKPDMTFPQLLEALEEVHAEEHNELLQALGATRREQERPSNKTSQQRKAEPSNLTNSNQASSPPKLESDISTSQSERWKLAAKVL